jgi:hypothetical protein
VLSIKLKTNSLPLTFFLFVPSLSIGLSSCSKKGDSSANKSSSSRGYTYVELPNQNSDESKRGVGPKKQNVSPDDLQVWKAKTPEQRREEESHKKLLLDQVSSVISKNRDQNKSFDEQLQQKRREIEERPAGVSQDIVDAPFLSLNKYISKGDIHEFIEDIRDWQNEIEASKKYKPKAELAKYWEKSFQEDYVHKNGLLKIFENAKEYKINLQTENGREASAFINHILFVKAKLERDASQEKENDHLSIQKDIFLEHVDLLIKEILIWANSPDSQINKRELKVTVQNYIAFSESFKNSNDPLSVQIENFLSRNM